MPDDNNHTGKQSQLDKFKKAARQLECDEDEAAFEEKLKKIATPEPIKGDAEPK